MIVGIVLIAIALTAGVVGIVRSLDKGFDNTKQNSAPRKPAPSKSEPTPQSTPETTSKPEPSTGRLVPSGIPSGSSYVEGDSETHRFNYYSNLPNDDFVSEAAVNFAQNLVIIRGTDNSGRTFGAIYKRTSLGFMFGYPGFEDNDKDALRKIGSDFLSVYDL